MWWIVPLVQASAAHKAADRTASNAVVILADISTMYIMSTIMMTCGGHPNSGPVSSGLATKGSAPCNPPSRHTHTASSAQDEAQSVARQTDDAR